MRAGLVKKPTRFDSCHLAVFRSMTRGRELWMKITSTPATTSSLYRRGHCGQPLRFGDKRCAPWLQLAALRTRRVFLSYCMLPPAPARNPLVQISAPGAVDGTLASALRSKCEGSHTRESEASCAFLVEPVASPTTTKLQSKPGRRRGRARGG
jgi:hypothetical protein